MSEEPEVTRGQAKRRGSAGALASSAVLIVSVVVVLGLGRALQTSPDASAETPRPAPTTLPPLPLAAGAGADAEPPPPVLAPLREAAPRPAPPAEPLPPLAARAAADLTRLAAHRGSWTAQVLLACKIETVERLLDRQPQSAELFVVPVEFRGESCFRLCWGTYASPKEAAAAADRPASLLGEPVRAIQVEEALP